MRRKLLISLLSLPAFSCLLLCACQRQNITFGSQEQTAFAGDTPAQTESEPIQETQSSAAAETSIANPAPALLYQRDAIYDAKTGVQRFTLDTQGMNASIYFEIPVFEETTAGRRKINAFFQNLEQNFFSPENENLSADWEHISSRPDHGTYFYENDAFICTDTETWISVSISYYWNMGGVNDTGCTNYNFSAKTGEMLKLSGLIEESEPEALTALYNALREEYDSFDLDWERIREYSLDDFDFCIYEDGIFIDFDRYEIADGAAGSFSLRLPVHLRTSE